MDTKTDISYGIVPVWKHEHGLDVLIVHQISYRGDDFWIFPKGHAEEGETPLETAKRELQEETGIASVTVVDQEPIIIEYSFVHEGIRIDKSVQYFIGFCDSKETLITQPEEIKELRWCDVVTADALLSHTNSKKVLKEVVERCSSRM